MNRDLVSRIASRPSLDPAVLTATTNGAVVDTVGFDSAMLQAFTGAIAGAGDFAIKLQHGTLANGSDMVDVPAADLLPDVSPPPATLLASSTYQIGYGGGLRYLRAVAVRTGGTSIALGAGIVLGHPSRAAV